MFTRQRDHHMLASKETIMRIVALAIFSVLVTAPLGGCVTKAAAAAVEAPGRVAGGLLGG